jgi:hypothetical protein
VLGRYFVKMDDGHYNKRIAEIVAHSEQIAGYRREGGLRSAITRRAKARRGSAEKNELKLNSSSTSVELQSVSPSPSPSSLLEPLHLLSTEDSEVVVAAEPTTTQGTTYKVPNCPTAKLLDAYHRLLPSLPRVEIMNATRQKHLVARWREVCGTEKFDTTAGVGWFESFFAGAARSEFLMGKLPGKSGRTWKADFDFLVGPKGFTGVIEGKYHHGG